MKNSFITYMLLIAIACAGAFLGGFVVYSKSNINPVSIAHVRNSEVYQITSADHICFVYERSISCLDKR